MMGLFGIQYITLSARQLKKCEDFSFESAKSQQQIEFGNHETIPRSINELARDNLIGKLAEGAFAVFLYKNFGIRVELDFNVYSRGRWDAEDFNLNNRPIDIKGTREGGRWLLVELNKLEFRKKEGKLPAYFLFATTGWDRVTDKPTGTVGLQGYASLNEICNLENIGQRTAAICDGIQNTIFLSRGEFIPNTRTLLQADNCARKATYLQKDWAKLITDTSSGE